MIKEKQAEDHLMKIKLLVISILLFFSIACNISIPVGNILESENLVQTEVISPNSAIVPDTNNSLPTAQQQTNQATGPNILDDTVINPNSGNQLVVHVGFPINQELSDLPTMVLVPGGIADSTTFIGKEELMGLLTRAGFMVVIFDADGRGQSEGEEDYNGFIHQDGLAAVIEYAANRPESDGRVGLLSLSYGVTMASGTLSRYPDLPVRFYMDWEGPAERFDTTVNCTPNGRIEWAPCDDETFWSEREALRFISSIHVPYLRVQSEIDHVQADTEHALNLIYVATQGTSPWVRLDNNPVNEPIDFNNPPAMLSEEDSKNLNRLLMIYIIELDQLF
jgi:pimeloyl-ACP methyl ester carboxylesterase